MYARIFTGITSLLLGSFLIFISFSFGASGENEEMRTDSIHEVFMSGDTLEFKALSPPFTSTAENRTLFSDIGRLAFAFYTPGEGKSAQTAFSHTGDTIVVQSGAYIFGLYDPFTTYSIVSSSFKLEQITNGSIYVGTEKDGTISIYTLDGVARLYFMADGMEMTDMMLFPGNYIRFDPLRNGQLDNVDLFRIILSLDKGSNQTFEYVNPKLDLSSGITNYRFGTKNPLIRMLHRYLQDKVENLDDIVQKYGKTNLFAGINDSVLFVNPAKKNHFLLLALSSELAKTVTSTASQKDSISKIRDLYQASAVMGIQPLVKRTLEQFIIDGRFAVYGGKVNADFDSIYTSIASMIGITPSTERSKILQNLSDIYAKNIVSRANQASVTRSDVYAATANILIDTLSSSEKLTSKDFFDVAVYSFNILLKAENEGKYMQEYLLNPNTYRILLTFFQSSSHYYNSIEVEEKKQLAIRTFAIQFYDHIFATLAKSITETFTYKDSSGFIFLQPEFRIDDVRPKIDRIIVAGIRENIEIGNDLLALLALLPKETNSNLAYSVEARIGSSVATMRGFLLMIENYKAYVKNPRTILEVANQTNLATIPSLGIPVLTGSTLSSVPLPDEPITRTPEPEDPLDRIRTLFPLITPSLVTLSGSNYALSLVPFVAMDTASGPHEAYFSAFYSSEKRVFSDMKLSYSGMTISVIPERMPLALFNRYILWLGDYFAKVDELLMNQGAIGTDIRFSLQENNIYLGDKAISIRE